MVCHFSCSVRHETNLYKQRLETQTNFLISPYQHIQHQQIKNNKFETSNFPKTKVYSIPQKHHA